MKALGIKGQHHIQSQTTKDKDKSRCRLADSPGQREKIAREEIDKADELDIIGISLEALGVIAEGRLQTFAHLRLWPKLMVPS